eukprot:TRINITY_DN13011_c0_g1_i1.p1 TRINITY_DN13011_c0_g1~~TRINITY_DN13011_c0_g1_i1.p1  ORF type:complete len:596 (-),score=88.12 TRINITY_DN13011_c0_g1_i1:18-1805(-)
MAEAATNTGPLMTHMSLFIPTIMGQGNMEQVSDFLFRALNFKIVGSYAQTELGHGSNVRGLQTIATYDKKTQEFVLNTPTLQSMKWWNSNIGITATHAAVYAQLVLDGKEYGVHVFMVQVRDENHMPLPGIEMGDLGEKMGDHGIDTGYMRLKDVRIPRTNLLAKRQHVRADGTYVKHKSKGGSSKAHYLTMMGARAGMIYVSGGKLAIAATIAARYSCVRRQGFAKSGKVSYAEKERKIIDYKIQQYRVLKQVATAYVLRLCGQWMNTAFTTFSEQMGSDQIDENDIVEIHATSSGLKGLCTKIAADGIEDCRKSCGGHGYLLGSGVAALSVDYLWQTTAEGDFIVMLLQTARYLVKCWRSAKEGKAVPGFMSYLKLLSEPSFDPLKRTGPRAGAPSDFLDLDFLLSLYRQRATLLVCDAAEQLEAKLANADFAVAWNECSLPLLLASEAHCYYFLLDQFAQYTRRSVSEGDEIHKQLHGLCALFATANIVEGKGWNGVLDATETRHAREAVNVITASLRRNVVGLVDAFDFHDNVLNSVLGRSDGNVYEALYESARKSRLNQTVPFLGYKFLRPHLDLDFLKKGNTAQQRANL